MIGYPRQSRRRKLSPAGREEGCEGRRRVMRVDSTTAEGRRKRGPAVGGG